MTNRGFGFIRDEGGIPGAIISDLVLDLLTAPGEDDTPTGRIVMQVIQQMQQQGQLEPQEPELLGIAPPLSG